MFFLCPPSPGVGVEAFPQLAFHGRTDAKPSDGRQTSWLFLLSGLPPRDRFDTFRLTNGNLTQFARFGRRFQPKERPAGPNGAPCSLSVALTASVVLALVGSAMYWASTPLPCLGY